jgi:hypothetical protein
MKKDRFFTAILIGIGLIVLLAFAAFFLRNSSAQYQPDSSPSGVVSNYVLALYRQDFQKAYAYLADQPNKPAFEQFQLAFTSNTLNIGSVSLQSNGENISSDSAAAVFLTLTYTDGGLFQEAYSNTDSAALQKQNGAWKISSMPYPFWNWDWYQPDPEEK